MMTFLVCADFIRNATLLDDQRLAKQRVEAKQILDAIVRRRSGAGGGWVNHPAVAAWELYVEALKYYYNCIVAEFIRRGGQNNMPFLEVPSVIVMPWWASWSRLHQSHQAMLMRKNPFFYKFTVEPEYLTRGYIWPDKVPYENRMAPLSTISAEIPPELVNPVYCSAILKSGARANQMCSRLVKDGQPKCTIHRK